VKTLVGGVGASRLYLRHNSFGASDTREGKLSVLDPRGIKCGREDLEHLQEKKKLKAASWRELVGLCLEIGACLARTELILSIP
jgi:hypothetical protein